MGSVIIKEIYEMNMELGDDRPAILVYCLKLLTFLFLVSTPSLSQAQSEESPQDKGKRIAFKAEGNFDHYGNYTADIVMQLNKKDGKLISRKMSLKVKENPGEGDRVLMQFHHPADVKGMAFLIWTHKTQFDDLWIYIPDLRRVKRVSSQTKGSDFMGSEFQTEDMIRAEPELSIATNRVIRPTGKTGQDA